MKVFVIIVTRNALSIEKVFIPTTNVTIPTRLQ